MRFIFRLVPINSDDKGRTATVLLMIISSLRVTADFDFGVLMTARSQIALPLSTVIAF